MKKRKWLLTALAAASALACALGLVACGEEAENPPSNGDQADNDVPSHTHSWATVLSKDDLHHWYACTGCNEKKDEAAHDVTSGECVCGLKASANLEFALNDDGNTYSVVGIGECTDTEIVIPAVYEGKPVTAIGEHAFMENDTITRVTILNNVTSIGAGAFFFCHALKEVSIPDSVTSIGYFAEDSAYYEYYVFYYCTSLESITVDANNQNYTSQDGALFNRNKTTLYCVPAGIKATAFSIPDGVTEIGTGAFLSCHALKEIKIPDSVTTIKDTAFGECVSLTNIKIPEGVTKLEEATFDLCTSLTSVTLPESLIKIGRGAFGDCTSLESITIPNNVTEIDNSAFVGCISLASITISENVTRIGKYAFQKCTSLTEIIVDVNNGYYASQDGVLYNKNKTVLECFPAGVKGTFRIPEGVTEIADDAFSGCSSLTNIILPESLKKVGRSAFVNCSFTSITIPEGVTEIGGSAFLGCPLVNITFQGTRAQWEEIGYRIENENCTVHCSDDE